jgi:cation transport ATPase
VNSAPPNIQSLLNRPISERIREHKYRFAQCMVFGLPVIALHFFGPKLGGPEAARWIGLLQALLAGWCLYIGALPLLSEGAMLLSLGKLKFDLVVALAAMVLCIVGVVGWFFTLRGRAPPVSGGFAMEVVLLVLWSLVQWLWLQRR